MAKERPMSMSKLEEALSNSLVLETGSPENEWEPVNRLRSIAGRYRGQILDAENIAAELVEAILGWTFGTSPETTTFSRGLVLAVTRSIMDDPAAHQRLSRLWIMLGEENE